MKKSLGSRYEIRQLTLLDAPAVAALVIETNWYSSPLWAPKYSKVPLHEVLTSEVWDSLLCHTSFQIRSGLSYGIFDNEYKFRNSASVDDQHPNGTFHWKVGDITPDHEDLKSRMDFSLVSFALARDRFTPVDLAKLKPFMDLVLKELIFLVMWQRSRDRRPDEKKKPKGPNQIADQGGSGTRSEYEGRGLARMLNDFVMHECHRHGFSEIHIGTAHDAMAWIWQNPPCPYKSKTLGAIFVNELELPSPETGQLIKPIDYSKQTLCAVQVFLR